MMNKLNESKITAELSLVERTLRFPDGTEETRQLPEITLRYGDGLKSQCKLFLSDKIPTLISFNDNAQNPLPKTATRKDIKRLIKNLLRNESRVFNYKKTKSCPLNFAYRESNSELLKLNVFSRFTIELKIENPPKAIIKAMKERLAPNAYLVFDFVSYTHSDNYFCFFHLVKEENTGKGAQASISLEDVMPLLKDLEKY